MKKVKSTFNKGTRDEFSMINLELSDDEMNMTVAEVRQFLSTKGMELRLTLSGSNVVREVTSI